MFNNYNPDHNQYISLNNIETDSNDGERYFTSKKIYYIMPYLSIFLTIMFFFALAIYLFTLYIHK